jgi:hypothetical protein
MLRFCGFDLELIVQAVLSADQGPALYCARDFTGNQWLITQVDDDPAHLAWLCAPMSDRAMDAIVKGQAFPRDAVRHSATGTVEPVTVEDGQAIPDQCLLCATLPEHLLPKVDYRVSMAA